MSDTAKRDAVLREFMPCGGHVCKGCDVQCTNVDGRTPSVAWMADEILRLRAENAALTAAIDRVRALHAGRVVSSGLHRVCWECEMPFPCPTIRALEATP